MLRDVHSVFASLIGGTARTPASRKEDMMKTQMKTGIGATMAATKQVIEG
jgi:hypothetical protein